MIQTLRTLPAWPRLLLWSLALLLVNPLWLSGCKQAPANSSEATKATQQAPAIHAQKPTLVQVHASWCPACQNIAPTWQRLEKTYAGKVNFVVLDVSNPRQLKTASQSAKALGLADWFDRNQGNTSTVVLLLPPASKGHIQETFVNQTDFTAYEASLRPFIEPKP